MTAAKHDDHVNRGGKNPDGSPKTKYTPETCMEIIQAIEEQGYIKVVLNADRPKHWPCHQQWREWIAKSEDLAREQDRAVAEYGAKLGYETIQIADGKDLLPGEQYDYLRARLRVNSRQWAAEKLAKPIFGKSETIQHANPDGTALNVIMVPRKDDSQPT